VLLRNLASWMRDTLDTKLAKFLRKQRGDMTYEQFSRKLGITKTTLFRIENGQQSITLRMLQQIVSRLRVNVTEVFGED
jgi:transcriptional regulator with XRE-family HTH domain